MFHYNGRPISRQEMTEMLADRHAVIDLAKKQRQREKDGIEAKLIRRDRFLFVLNTFAIALAIGSLFVVVLK